MDAPAPLSIASFVIRFVVDPASNTYRGEVRHIQTNEEIRFHAWSEAVAFIRRFVPLETEETSSD